jgi:superfamily I DNA and RNA helicase
MVTTVRGATTKPVSSQRLAQLFAAKQELDGFLYIGYPIIGTPDGAHTIDALWITPGKGLIIINLVEGRETNGYQEAQDDSANKLEAKLRTHRSLVKGRTLAIPLHVVTFAPIAECNSGDVDTDYPLCSSSNLIPWLESIQEREDSRYEASLSVIQSISTIRKGRKRREPKNAESRGARLKALEDSIANLDTFQGQAVIETVEGVQRVRGLAGSGKTIVLALKAAYLHAQHPEWKIAVTFHTRSLKAQLKSLISTFYIEHVNEEPDWENLQILHAWGAPGGSEKNGMYYNFCRAHDLEFLDFRSAQARFGMGREFEGACEQALASTIHSEPHYDMILVDEAQDFSPAFLRLCFEYVCEPKRLVYAYDELQNLSGRSLPAPEEIFGQDSNGQPRVRFAEQELGGPQQDVILEKCYRNSRPVLATAHALGFGIYRTPTNAGRTGLIQMFDHRHLWTEIGYRVIQGRLDEGEEVALARTDATSPRFLEAHSPIDDLLVFKAFETPEAQAEWIVQEIRRNLSIDELFPDDIIVINPDPLSTRNAVGLTRKLLFENGINSHLAGVDTSPDVFFTRGNDSIAFSGVYRAKGNEAGMVYVMNAQDCFSSIGNLSRIRNRLFTAITRSKAWVRVLGVGPNMEKLKEEFERVKERNFVLNFKYPTAEERKQLTIVNRDMTADEKRRIQEGSSQLEALLDDLQDGKIFLADLPADQIRRLKAMLEEEAT